MSRKITTRLLFNRENSAGATVYDMTETPPKRITQVLNVDVDNATVLRHADIKGYPSMVEQTIEFDTIYFFPASGPPRLFHCY